MFGAVCFCKNVNLIFSTPLASIEFRFFALFFFFASFLLSVRKSAKCFWPVVLPSFSILQRPHLSDGSYVVVRRYPCNGIHFSCSRWTLCIAPSAQHSLYEFHLHCSYIRYAKCFTVVRSEHTKWRKMTGIRTSGSPSLARRILDYYLQQIYRDASFIFFRSVSRNVYSIAFEFDLSIWCEANFV